MAKGKDKHQWRFFRAGGLDQPRLDRGSDFVNLPELDQKNWVALACPASGLHFDTATLKLIDTDGDGRVRAQELLAAVKWTCSLLRQPDDLVKGAAALPAAAINDSTDEGKALAACAREVLKGLGKAESGAVTVDDVVKAAEVYNARPFNGDGVVCEHSTDSPDLKQLIGDIAACCGPARDASGKPGITREMADRFFAEAAAYAEWWAKRSGKDVLPLGEKTDEAAAAVDAVKARIDDYFARCRLAAFDSRAGALLNRAEADIAALSARQLTAGSEEIAAFPLAQVKAGAPLPLAGAVNPAWAAPLARFAALAAGPLAGASATLTEEQWGAVNARLAAYRQWQSQKPAGTVAKLGAERVKAIVGAGRDPLDKLFAQEDDRKGDAATRAGLERLVRYYRDLHQLCTNFVNFRGFYGPHPAATFQAGRLYIDQRSCDLCIRVEDPAKHAAMAGLAGAYLAYCDCVRKATGEKMQIVAVITNGDSDNLMVGRNGVFYDRDGKDWDATITKIIDNPISLRQAFWSPYKKLVRMIEEQIAKRAAAAESASDKALAAAAATTAQADKAKPPAPPAKKVDVGTVAALGVAFGAIGTFVAAVMGYVSGIIKMGPFAIVGALLGLIAVISLPSVILAYIKLRKRNLGPILDANGWAVNAQARISVPFGAALTQLSKLPPGSQRDLTDPYAEKSNPWPRLIVLALVLYLAWVVLNRMGLVYEWTGGKIGKAKQVESVVK